jgi:hypothetical protein
MPRHRRSVYSNSARFADLRVVCLSRAIEYKPVLVVVYYWIGIRIGVGIDGIDTTCLVAVGLRIVQRCIRMGRRCRIVWVMVGLDTVIFILLR